jgi:hypothetical protein
LHGMHILELSRLLSSPHFCLLKLQHLLTHVSFFIITDYDVQFIFREDSVGFHSLIP